jgi:hypothetical protein
MGNKIRITLIHGPPRCRWEVHSQVQKKVRNQVFSAFFFISRF